MMKRTAFNAIEIERARRLLGLREQASIQEIKAAYRGMCKRWHPDALSEDPRDSKKIKEINAAYRLLLDYCENYPFSFLPEVVESFDPEKWWYQRFGENIRAEREEEEDE
jgi:preprotein translocase subunit Sec63